MKDSNEQHFVENVRRELDAQADSLDELTLAKLRAARKRALDHAPRQGLIWFPALGTATAAALALAVLLWPSTSELPGALEDMDIVASQDDLELIDEYEFYEWLEATEATG